MRKIATLTLILVSLIVSDAFAYDANGPWTKVDQIYSPVENSTFVYFKADSMPGCYGNRGGYIAPSNSDGQDRIYSILVAALMADRDVQVFYNYVAEDPGTWGRCHIVSVYVR